MSFKVTKITSTYFQGSRNSFALSPIDDDAWDQEITAIYWQPRQLVKS